MHRCVFVYRNFFLYLINLTILKFDNSVYIFTSISLANHIIALQYDLDRFTKRCNINNMPLNTLKFVRILLHRSRFAINS